MSIGYPDFNTRELLDQYSVTTRFLQSTTIPTEQLYAEYTNSGFGGILKSLSISLDSGSLSDGYIINIYVDDLIVESRSIYYNKANKLIETKNDYLRITKQDYKNQLLTVELIKDIQFFDSYSVDVLFVSSHSSTKYTLTINYIVSNPNMLYPS